VSDWTLVYFETIGGRQPVRDYLEALEADERAQMTFDLDLLSEFGISLGAPYVRSISGKLRELRTRGRRQHRVLFFAVVGRRIVLLHAFVKKTPKTPAREIEVATRRMAEFAERYKE
jgi:phage-related protein